MRSRIGWKANSLLLSSAAATFFISSCDDPSGPGNAGEPSLSVNDYSHYHCELQWTQLDLEGIEHDSYHLYCSESPDIVSDTTGLWIATYDELDELQHVDETLKPGITYYYALLTGTQNSTDAADYYWSNEVQVTADEVIVVKVINQSGVDLHLAVHQANQGDEVFPWLKNIGDKSLWEENTANMIQDSCVAEIQAGTVLTFHYPYYFQSGDSSSTEPPRGARIYIGESRDILTNGGIAPNLASAPFIYDKVETGWPYPTGAPAVWNTTCVDFVAFPMQLQHNSDSQVGFISTCTRSSMLTALTHDLPSKYNVLAGPASSSDPHPTRFFSPGQYFADPTTHTDWLDNALAAGLSNHNGETWSCPDFTFADVHFDPTTSTMTAVCNGNTVTAPGLSSATVFGCRFQPPTGTPAEWRFCAVIAAAANRGVLNDFSLWYDSTAYYNQNNPGNFGEFNYYSQYLHSVSQDKKCYGFAWDDINEQASTLNNVFPMDTVTITVLKFDS